jgi:hypothetical protein
MVCGSTAVADNPLLIPLFLEMEAAAFLIGKVKPKRKYIHL